MLKIRGQLKQFYKVGHISLYLFEEYPIYTTDLKIKCLLSTRATELMCKLFSFCYTTHIPFHHSSVMLTCKSS